MNKIGIVTLLTTVTLLFTLALAFPAAAGPKVAANAAAAPMPPHPHVHESVEAMREAKRHMEMAEGEFRGHRAKAIEHLNMAIHEAEICEQEP